MMFRRMTRFCSAGLRGRLPWLTATAFVALWLAAAPTHGAERLDVAVLTRDLGDPRAPGNLKLVVTLPDELYQHNLAATARSFSIYIYPNHLSEAEGTIAEHLADGVYLWRSGSKIFLDARVVPIQEAEGHAVVKVVFHPQDEVLAEGVADGVVTYATQLVDVIMAVDISSSMNYTDPRRRRVTAASAFIDMARQGGGIGRVGLITFNSQARTVTPLLPLSEGQILLDALTRIGANGMTSLDAPLRMGMEELTAGSGSRRPVIILLTDGRNEGSRYRNTHLELAEKGIRIYTIGLTERADHKILKEMADATGGLYFRAPTDEDLPEIYARLATELGKRRMLQADVLRSEQGRIYIPIDGSVKRLAAIADGGARVGVIRPENQGLYAGGRLTSVHMINPSSGLWGFSWQQATPEVSSLSLFGDTQFFLDVFPPQMRGTRLSVGATLAEGTRPLAGGRVWAQPVPGIFDHPIEMYDDGQHGDGAAGDGVYGAVIDFNHGDIERFDMGFRAAGAAWDKGDFVRQASGLAIRSHEPSGDGTVKLEGDLDFGVLFPGETGSALARIHLDARGPHEFDIGLYWNAGYDWPDMSSRVVVQPGRRAFELEMTIPENAQPGDYTGRLAVSDRDDLGDSGDAYVRVGTVRFAEPPFIDLGIIPPGTFVVRDIRLPYNADKEAELHVEGEGDGLRVTPGVTLLSEGRGEIPVEAVVTVPMGMPEGEYSGMLRLFAGPGRGEFPLRWRVKSYATAPQSGQLPPVAGVPAFPEFSAEAEMAALSEPPPMNELLFPSEAASPESMGDGDRLSPWERASQAIGNRSAMPPVLLPGPGDFDFTASVGQPKKVSGESWWSAWWVYLLAILLLLLLLLLLAAYILYRLGKSQLARLLLAAGLANLLLLAVFIALLGTSAAAGPASAPTVTISLVEDDYRPVEDYLTDLEKDMLTAPAAQSTSELASESIGAGGETATAGQVSLAPPHSAGGGLISERNFETADNSRGQNESQLAMASNPSAMPLENADRQPMNRRERRPDRPSMTEPIHNLPDFSEAPAEPGAAVGEHVEVGETRLEIEASNESDRPVWSDGDRVAQPMAVQEDLLMAETPGMETVSMDSVSRRMDPHGRRRNIREAPEIYPEPRVEIADPIRDSEAVAVPDVPDSLEGRPGVEEIRSEPRSMGAGEGGAKPGTLLALAVSSLNKDIDRQVPRGISGEDGSAPALAQGGARTSRGGTGRPGAARSGPTGNLPGGLMNDESDNQRQGSATSGGSGGAGGGDIVGERRFNSSEGGSSNGQPNSGGFSRSPAEQGQGGGSGMEPSQINGGDGSGAGPSQLAGGAGSSGDGDRVVFSPGGGGFGQSGSPGRHGGSGDGNSRFSGNGAEHSLPGLSGLGRGRGPHQGQGRGFGGDMPDGLGSVPGGGVGTGQGTGKGDGDSSGTGRGRGPGGVGEGRFDDIPGSGGGFGLVQRGGAISTGMGQNNLGGGDSGPGAGAVSMVVDNESWFVERRRESRRHVAAAASSLEIDNLLIVLGDFVRLPDPAAENLFAVLAGRIGGGMVVEERRLAPDDANLSDTLLAVLSPEEARDWSDADLAKIGAYLVGGGHIWMDGFRQTKADDFMRRLARAAGGEYGPLPASHQLSEFDKVDAITIGDKIAAVATAQDWRNSWRYGDGGDGSTLRFLIRALNYFLSGNADSGIVLDSAELRGDLFIEPTEERIPETLSAGKVPEGRVWDAFNPDSIDAWRMPAWSDSGKVSAISDGQGGRALKLDLGAAEKGRVAIYRALNPNQDFSRVERLTVDVYYDGDGEAAVSLVLTVPTGGGWRDFEAPPAHVSPGWNQIEFRLKESTFRPLSNGGAFASALPGAERMGRVGFFLYRNGSSLAIGMFRDIRLHEQR